MSTAHLTGSGKESPAVPVDENSPRALIVYRSRDDAQLGSHRPRRGWDWVG